MQVYLLYMLYSYQLTFYTDKVFRQNYTSALIVQMHINLFPLIIHVNMTLPTDCFVTIFKCCMSDLLFQSSPKVLAQRSSSQWNSGTATSAKTHITCHQLDRVFSYGEPCSLVLTQLVFVQMTQMITEVKPSPFGLLLPFRDHQYSA